MRLKHVAEYDQIAKQEHADKKRRQYEQSAQSSSGSTSSQTNLKQPILLNASLSSSKKFDHDHPKQKLITEKIGLMICKDLQPYTVVEDAGFRAVMQAAEPRYVMPSRKTFRDDIVPNIHKTALAMVKRDASSAISLAVTTDAWTSRSNQSFISYTAHFLTPDFTM